MCIAFSILMLGYILLVGSRPGLWIASRWDPRRDFTQDWWDPGQDYGLPQMGSCLGSHPGLALSRVGSHLRCSEIPVEIPPASCRFHPGLSIFCIDVGIYILVGSRPGLWIAPRWDPRQNFTQDWWDPDQNYGLPQVGSHPGSARSRVGSHPRRSIIPLGISPGIKTESCVGMVVSHFYLGCEANIGGLETLGVIMESMVAYQSSYF